MLLLLSSILLFEGFVLYKSIFIGELVEAGRDAVVLRQQIATIEKVTFYFMCFTILFISGSVIYVFYILKISMDVIIHGITEIEHGNFSYKIPDFLDNEFGFIARFFNKATNNLAEVLHRQTASIRDEQLKSSAILKGISDGVIAVDKDMIVVSVNEAAGIILDMNTHNIINQKISDVIKSPHVGVVMDALRTLTEMKKVRIEVIGALMTRWVQCKISPLPPDTKSPVFAIIT